MVYCIQLYQLYSHPRNYFNLYKSKRLNNWESHTEKQDKNPFCESIKERGKLITKSFD